MKRTINRSLAVSTIALTLLFAVAAYAVSGPVLSPTQAVLKAGTTMKFKVYKSNDQVWEKWTIIESDDDNAQITQDGTFYSGDKAGSVLVEVQTSDYGLNHPSFAHVQVIP